MAPEGRPLVLWAVPRSVSTAFERVFVEREDFEVFHEPFSAAYYFGPERRSARFAGEESREEHRYAAVLERILAPRDRPVFIKDMAYHVSPVMDREFVSRFTNTFIIREPSQVLSSLHRMWPDFTLEEAGFEQLHRLWRLAAEAGREEPVVVDAHDLSSDAGATVRAYCEALGIPFDPEALSWEPRKVPEWRRWEEWHTEAQESTGIEEIPQGKAPLPPELRPAYEHCLPYYRELHARRLRVSY
ncbi:conserved hypothetical protein [Rubrobacter xylanophilus DSM 9941]|uniref:Sulfotransferase family protein n=1 Tax=Rubrobacter xylanophilus (strain DSM 9941 / JCM 11954 / NBRC 16129 / PRD-1) TaxID=266117 RepID=Q1AXY6_RUBXD|nr:hypothetical protein [Rubrobacter xylanophilus]ABG03742.1 conserved hypothetical protein [Rubrobacter xylanophilus DSM 9941]